MDIIIHNHYKYDDSKILSLLNSNTQKLNEMANEIEDLTAEVAETKGIMASAKVLIEGFSKALGEALNDPAKLKALKDDLDSGSSELANAIASNPLPGEIQPPTGENLPPTGGEGFKKPTNKP